MARQAAGVVKVAKTLTPNDLGLTGGHQAGLHVPKDSPLAKFIGDDIRHAVNPRKAIALIDVHSGQSCSATLIYYNNVLRGGTRDEFRITGTTAFLRRLAAQVGDELIFDIEGREELKVSLVRRPAGAQGISDDDGPIKLSGKWRFIGGNA